MPERQMKTGLEGIPADVPPPISITVLYEDTPAREQAMKVCQRLARKLRGDFNFEFKWWKFAFLHDRHLAKDAADAAVQADLVIVSTDADRELPSGIKRWMKACLSRRRKADGALVALMRMANGLKGTTPVHDFLLAIAQRVKMDYLPELVYPTR